MSYTQEIINDLIKCEKRIIEAPTREFKEENRHRRKDMRLCDAKNEDRQYIVFIRQSLEFCEDFSLGLIYLAPEGKRITLIRFNGQHDQSNDILDQAKLHFQYHIHLATPENLNNERYDKHPSSIASDYASFEEATKKFLTEIALENSEVENHFPTIEQMSLLPFEYFGDNP